MADNLNRVAVLWVSGELLVELLGFTRFDVQLNNIPQNVKFVRGFHDWATDMFGLLLSHPSFDAVPPGEMPPVLQASIRRTIKPVEKATMPEQKMTDTKQEVEIITEQSFRDEFLCGHCLQVTPADDCPAECPHCRVGYCQSCGTRQHQDSRFCFGCAQIVPDIKARMVRTSSFGSFYLCDNWAKAGLPEGQDWTFHISVGWDTADDMRGGKPVSINLYKELPGGKRETVRTLTQEEYDMTHKKLALSNDL